MYDIFMKTLPFFALIGVGFWAGKTRFFTEEATAYLTKFVFYFALSAMLFKFSSNLSLGDLLNWDFIFAYLCATTLVYILATIVSLVRKKPMAEAAIEAQCAVIGNVGFLGIPMLALLMGQDAVGHVMMVLAVDLLVFGSLVVMIIVGSRDGRMHVGIFKTLAKGLIKNPMIVSIIIGLAWSAWEIPIPAPLNEFMCCDAWGLVCHWCVTCIEIGRTGGNGRVVVRVQIAVASLGRHLFRSLCVPCRSLCGGGDDCGSVVAGGGKHLHDCAALQCGAATGVSLNPHLDRCFNRDRVCGHCVGHAALFLISFAKG
jgi:hypothetical protein